MSTKFLIASEETYGDKEEAKAALERLLIIHGIPDGKLLVLELDHLDS